MHALPIQSDATGNCRLRVGIPVKHTAHHPIPATGIRRLWVDSARSLPHQAATGSRRPKAGSGSHVIIALKQPIAACGKLRPEVYGARVIVVPVFEVTIEGRG